MSVALCSSARTSCSPPGPSRPLLARPRLRRLGLGLGIGLGLGLGLAKPKPNPKPNPNPDLRSTLLCSRSSASAGALPHVSRFSSRRSVCSGGGGGGGGEGDGGDEGEAGASSC